MVTTMMNTQDLLPEPPQSDELFVTFANTLAYTRGVASDLVSEPEALLGWLKENGLISERGRAMEAQRLLRDPAQAQRRPDRFRYLRWRVDAIRKRANGGHPPK